MHVGLATKPRKLTLGVVAMALLRLGDGRFFTEAFEENRHCLAIAEGVEGLNGTVAGEKGAGFGDQARVEHFGTAAIEAVIERSSRRVQANAQQAKSGERVAGQDLGHGLSSGDTNFDRADELRRVVGMDAFGRCGIEARE